jgi:hypothetical protein
VKTLSRYIESCLSLGASLHPQSYSQYWLHTLQDLDIRSHSTSVPQSCWLTLKAHHCTRGADVSNLQHALKAHACGHEGLTEFLSGFILWNSPRMGVIKGHILRCELRVLYDSEHELLLLLPQTTPTKVELTPLGIDLISSHTSAHSWILQPGVTPSKAIDKLLTDLSVKIHPYSSYSSSFHPRGVSTDCPSLTMAPAIRTLLNPVRPILSLGRRVLSEMEKISSLMHQIRNPSYLAISQREVSSASRDVDSVSRGPRRILVVTSALTSHEIMRCFLNQVMSSQVGMDSLSTKQTSSSGLAQCRGRESSDLFLRALRKVRISQRSGAVPTPHVEDIVVLLSELLRKREQYEWIEGMLRPGQLPQVSPLSSSLIERIKTLPITRVHDFKENQRLLSSFDRISKEISHSYSKLLEVLEKLERIQRSLSPRQDVQYLAFLLQELPSKVRHEALAAFNKCYSLKKKHGQGLTTKLTEQLCAPPGYKMSTAWKRRSRQTAQLLHELTQLHDVKYISVETPENISRHLILSASKELSRPSYSLLSRISRSHRKAWATIKKVKINQKRVNTYEQLEKIQRYLRREEIHSQLCAMWQDTISKNTTTPEQMLSEIAQAHETLQSLCPLRDRVESLYAKHFEAYLDLSSETTTTNFHTIRRALAHSLSLERKRSIDEFLLKWKRKIESIEQDITANQSIRSLLSSLELGLAQEIRKNLRALKQELDDYHVLRETRSEIEKSGILRSNIINDFSDPHKIPELRNKLDTFAQAYEWRYKLQSLMNLFVEDTETELVLGLLQSLTHGVRLHDQSGEQRTFVPQRIDSLTPNFEVRTLEDLRTSKSLPIGEFDEVYAMLEGQDLGYGGTLFAFAPVVQMAYSGTGAGPLESSKVTLHFKKFFPESLCQSEQQQEVTVRDTAKRRISSTVTLHSLEVMNLTGTHPLNVHHLHELGFDAEEVIFSDTIQAARIQSSHSAVLLLHVDWDRLDEKISSSMLLKLARFSADKETVLIPLTSQGLTLLKHPDLLKAFLSGCRVKSKGLPSQANLSEDIFDGKRRLPQQHPSSAEDLIHPASLQPTSERRNSEYPLVH